MKPMQKKVRLVPTTVLGLLAATITCEALAQAALEEVVVTASRRETSMQDTPLAITALGADALSSQNVENLQDITAVVPNVLLYGTTGSGTNDTTINMRGIPGVGVYVDGIWQVTGAGLLLRPLLELDRIEVLRGPQGTLYGRDSTGGSIHIFTAPPADELRGSVQMAIGSFDRRDISASVDLPLGDMFKTKWTVAQYDRDGYITSQVTGSKSGSYEDTLLRGDLLFEPNDRLSMRLTYQEDEIAHLAPRVTNFIYPDVAWSDGTQVGVAQAHDIASGGRFNDRSARSGAPGGDVGEWENRQSLDMPSRQNLEQTTLTANYSVTDDVQFRYLYGGTTVWNANAQDYGGAEFNFFVDYRIIRTELDSHEIQFNGDQGRFHWSVGAYTWDQTARQRNRDYSAAEWVQAPDQGIPKTLDYNDVLASPACQVTAAERGFDFEGRARFDGSIVGPADGPHSWIIPCNGFLGNGILDLQALFLRSFDDAEENGQDGEAYFGELTVDINERLDITFGIRKHEQTNTSFQVDVDGGIAAGITEPAPFIVGHEFVDYARAIAGNVVASGPGSPLDPTSTTSFDNTSYRFGLSYDVNDDVMVYLGYNEGFNSGGTSSFFDTANNLIINNFDPEIIENTEIGVRADLMGGRMRLNATYFSTDWLGIQIQAQAIDPITGSVLTAVTTQNAASGEAEGVDVEFTYLASDNLTVGTNLGLLDTGYTSVQSGLTEAYDLDTTFTGAPDETYNFFAQYDWNLANGGSFTARVNYSYTGFYERSSLLSFRQRSILPHRDPEGGDFWMLDIRAVYTPPQGNYELSVYGNNLTDEYNLNSGFTHRFWNFDFGTVDNKREVGLGFRMNF